MKLYDGGRVPNARRVRIFLAEKQMVVPIEPVNLAKDEHKTETFSKLNPLHRVPVLMLDDGSVVTESIAICRFFETVQPQPSLFGATPREQVFVEMWQRRLEMELFLPVAHAFRHLHPSMAGYEVPQVAEWGNANRTRAVDFMRLLDQHMRGRNFVAGDAFSVADITGLVALDFVRAARIDIPADVPDLLRWHAALSARPSAKA